MKSLMNHQKAPVAAVSLCFLSLLLNVRHLLAMQDNYRKFVHFKIFTFLIKQKLIIFYLF